MVGTARAPAACGVLPSYATGQGWAFAIDIGQTVTVFLQKGRIQNTRIRVTSPYYSQKGLRLVCNCVTRVLDVASAPRSFFANVEVDFDQPIARGLKSSSSLAVAIINATAAALGIKIAKKHIAAIARWAEVESGLSKFGAVDDGFTTLYGGLICADCPSRRLIYRRTWDPQKALDIVVLAPSAGERRVPTGSRERLKDYALIARSLGKMVFAGYLSIPMTMSGLLHARHFGYPASPIVAALRAGARGATLSGKGPAVVAVVDRAKSVDVVNAWRPYHAKTLVTHVDNVGARLITNQ